MSARRKRVRHVRRRQLVALAAATGAAYAACALPGTDQGGARAEPVETAVPLEAAPPEPTATAVVTSPTPQPTPEPTPAPLPVVPIYYSPQYVLAGFSYETTRKAKWVADSLLTEPLARLELIAPRSLEESEVAALHDPVYVQSIRTGQPRPLAESQGWKWDSQLMPSVLSSSGGAVEAALYALKSSSRIAGSLSSGLHHAHKQYGLGNCTFNGLALAARAALGAGAKSLLLLDFDAHCGGGTNELVGGDPRVWHVDVAVHTFDRYTPQARQTLDVVQSARSYIPTVERRLDELTRRAPAFDLVLYNAGMDPHERCPVGGLPGITRDILDLRERIVFQWCRYRGFPVAFVLAGGFLGDGLDMVGLVGLHRLTLRAAAATV
jgi:acetoin utilization deacetylase AcuC-like enzyme